MTLFYSILSISAVVVCLASSSHAFVPLLGPAAKQTAGRYHQPFSLLSMSAGDEEAVQCYLIENEDDEEEDEKPTVVCTSEPEEYAWFNGIDEKKMKPTDGTETGATECVEGASPRGTAEWECK